MERKDGEAVVEVSEDSGGSEEEEEGEEEDGEEGEGREWHVRLIEWRAGVR